MKSKESGGRREDVVEAFVTSTEGSSLVLAGLLTSRLQTSYTTLVYSLIQLQA